jgi:hypothetical protein
MSHDHFTVDGALIEAMAAVGGEPPRAAGISTRT